jgi:hypothetical protein
MKKTILIASILLIHNCHDCAPKEYPELFQNQRMKKIIRASSKSYLFLTTIIFLSMNWYNILDNTSAKKDRIGLNGYIFNMPAS